MEPTAIGLVSLSSNSETHMSAICDARLIYGRGWISPVFICCMCNFNLDSEASFWNVFVTALIKIRTDMYLFSTGSVYIPDSSRKQLWGFFLLFYGIQHIADLSFQPAVLEHSGDLISSVNVQMGKRSKYTLSSKMIIIK